MPTPTKEMQKAGAPLGWSVVMPAEHGSWGILTSPFLCAAAIGAVWNIPLLLAAVCALTLFVLRGSMEAQGGLRTLSSPAHLTLFLVATLAGGLLFFSYRRQQLFDLGLLAAILYAMQLTFVRFHSWNREEKRSLGAELVGVALLSLGAPLAWIAARGTLDETGAEIWFPNLLFLLGGVLYVKYRVRGIRAHEAFAGITDRLAFAWPVFLYHAALLMVLIAQAVQHSRYAAVVLAFVPGFLRAWALLFQLGRRFPIRRLGWNEILHSAVFAGLLILAFQLIR